MKHANSLRLACLVTALTVGHAADVAAQGRPPMRKHTATESQPLKLVSAAKSIRGGEVQITYSGRKVTVTTNSLPDHAVGSFPNGGNPNGISKNRATYTATTGQKVGRARALGLGQLFGVAVNGIAFDPGAAEFWKGKPRSGWQYEALGGAVTLGLDANYAHVQPTGAYHYHGLPTGLMRDLGWSRNAASPLIGYAADGFPIYAITANVNGKVVKMQSSYRLKSGSRSGEGGPGGRYDGAFVQDYAYVKGAGQLDECNGATVRNADYPGCTYAYFLTENYPVVPRCLKGKADSSFSHQRR